MSVRVGVREPVVGAAACALRHGESLHLQGRVAQGGPRLRQFSRSRLFLSRGKAHGHEHRQPLRLGARSAQNPRPNRPDATRFRIYTGA